MHALRLPQSLAAWGSEMFKETLKQELACIGADRFPLQQGMSQSSIALDEELSFVFLSAHEHELGIRARLGVFFKGMIAGCSCADDPSPADEQSEYCEVWVDIDAASAQASIRLAD